MLTVCDATMTEPYPIRRAREAYRAYGQTTDFKNYQGLPMPAWDDLPEKIREAWVNASTAAACHHDPVNYTDRETPLGNEDDVALAEIIARLRCAAASLERRELTSVLLAVFLEKSAPFHSWRLSGEDQRSAHLAGASILHSLTGMANNLGATVDEARRAWVCVEAATPPADEAG